MPSHLPADLQRRLGAIRLLVLDVDGVLTDGRLIYGHDGEMAKAFSVRDGLAIVALQGMGVRVAVVTGRSSGIVSARMSELGVPDELVVQGSRDKSGDLDALLQRCGLGAEHLAAMGDDIPDLPMLARAAFSACPHDAAPEVLAACDFVCGQAGGHGAVREVAELILKAQGRWTEVVERFHPPSL